MTELKLKDIGKLYLDGKLFEDTDESGAGGYWDLAGDIAAELVNSDDTELGGMYDRLQTGIYGVFQKVLVRGERYE
jgi:hypothetical protein